MFVKEIEIRIKIYMYKDVYCRVIWKEFKGLIIVEWLSKL